MYKKGFYEFWRGNRSFDVSLCFVFKRGGSLEVGSVWDLEVEIWGFLVNYLIVLIFKDLVYSF